MKEASSSGLEENYLGCAREEGEEKRK